MEGQTSSILDMCRYTARGFPGQDSWSDGSYTF